MPKQNKGMRPFWSGTISFGLVTIPVAMYPATRSAQALSLRMLSPDGTPLSRIYVCPDHDEPVDADEIVRGYETEDGRYVRVEDEELERLAPEKSRDIDLRQFVDRDQIPLLYFDRLYFLAPASESTKAYRLLAESLEDRRTAGIATFVLRGNEHVVAILSEGGVLRAQLLRFEDEVRSPVSIGMGEPEQANKRDVDALRKIIRGRTRKDLDEEALVDETAEKLRQVAAEKAKAGKDVVKQGSRKRRRGTGEDVEVIDLVQVLQRSLKGKKKRRGRELSQEPKDVLYEKAQDLGIRGRSSMSKTELAEAIERATA